MIKIYVPKSPETLPPTLTEMPPTRAHPHSVQLNHLLLHSGRYVSLLQFQSSTDNIPLFTTYTTITVFSHVYKPHSHISRTPSSGRNFLGKTYLCTEFTINFKWKLSKNLLHWASMNQLQKQNWNRNKDWWMQNAHESLFNKMATKFIATARVGWNPRQIKNKFW